MVEGGTSTNQVEGNFKLLTNNPCFLSFSLVEQLPQNLVLQPLRTAQAAAYIYWA